ncbi:MAG: outer membrane protein assembly factor BamD [Gammaproteobacteria bacterium]|nr:outer membrane protein assembly factor BamD [Gammaproteobacteria bacterium]
MSGKFRILLVLAAVFLAACSSAKKEEPDLSAEEMYAAAKLSMSRNGWERALTQLRELIAKYPYGKHAEQAQLDEIYVHYRNNSPGLCIAAAERFIKEHPTHEAVDYAYYAKGLANYQEDDSLFGRLTGRDDLSDRDATITRDALDAFTDVYTLFPESRYAADSRARARRLTESLARHELAVAAYYLSRNAHVAVVNRAKGVVENYATTPALEHALALMIFSYRQMGLSELSESAKRVLALSFPQSEYLSGLDRGGRELLTRGLADLAAAGKAR